MTAPRILYQYACLDRNLHIILKYKKLKIHMVDRAATGKTLYFGYLTYGSRTVNRTDSPYQTVTG